MKKLLLLFAAILMASSTLLAEVVNYIDANGQSQSVDATEVTNSSTTLSAGWYVVLGTNVQTGSLVCDGAVNLILADGAKLTANGGLLEAGIQVSGTGNSLTIYGQTNQTGTLNAIAENGAGIGGNGEGGDGSNITINGGIITANSYNGSGIGGGAFGMGSNIFVSSNLLVLAGGNPAEPIAHSSTDDISGALAGKPYVKISEPKLTAADFNVSNNSAIYNGEEQAATVTLNVEGAGTMTVTYRQDGEVVNPIDAGEYDIFAAVSAGEIYHAFEATQIGTFTINKASLSADNFIFSLPEDLNYDGNAKTATVTFDDQNGQLTGCGSITVKYNDSPTAPVAAGTYTVSIDISEGMNFSAAQNITSDDWNFTITAALPMPANNQIFYQTSDHQKITLNNANDFGVAYNDANSVYYQEDDYGVVSFDGNITTIGDWAFANRTTLTAVVWPSTVTSIGEDAFDGCTNLSSVNLQEGITGIGEQAFAGCAGMEELTIPSTVTSIGNYAFTEWTSLTKLTVKAGSIGKDAFNGCTNLSSVNLQEGITGIGEDAFARCTGMENLIIPSTTTNIGARAFSGCTSLTELVVKAGSIGEQAFAGCTNLSSITLQEGVTSIGIRAFAGCVGVAEIIIPSTVNTIEEQAFYGLQGLTKLIVKAGSIGEEAFRNCTNLSTIDLQEGVTSIGIRAFVDCVGVAEIIIPSTVNTIEEQAFYGLQGLTKLIVKAESIGERAFQNCTNLSSVDLQGVTSIGQRAFNSCTNLSSVDLQGITSIGQMAFSNCDSIKELTIPSTVTSFGFSAFNDCISLTKLTVKSKNVAQAAFQNCTNLSSVDLQGVTMIEYGAFQNCTALTELIISNTVSTIGGMAFANCTALTELTFLNAVSTIDGGAFRNCSNVTSVTFLGYVVVNDAFGSVGTAESPVNLQLPSTWLSTDKPVDSATPWHGGYFNCEYIDPVKEFLGEMGEPCEDCPAVEVSKGTTTIKLYNPDKVEFKKME